MPGSPILSFGPYQLDFEKVQLWCDTQPVRLTPKAFQVLCYLVERPGQLVTKDELFRVVWVDTVVGDAALTMCIQEIRKALGDTPKSPQYLETVHRLGFRFIASVAAPVAPVPSSELQVLSKEEVVSSQELVDSRQEQSVNEQEVNSVMPAQAGIQGPKAPASDDPAWIPAFAGMTHPPSAPQNHHPSPQSDQVLSASTRPVRRSWSVRSLVFMGLVFLVGVILTVQYLSRPSLSTPDSALRTREAQLPLPDKPSIVVLPFANLSGDPAQDYFSDGITEELIASLARFPSLFVIARHSAFTYKGKEVKIQDVGKELGVRYVLEGSVRRAEQRVRINVQLVDAITGDHLWVERYDRAFSDIFTLQDEIVHKIVTTLKLQLTLEEQGIIVRKRTDNVEAYDYLLRGSQYDSRSTKEGNLQARQMFEKALELDPQYAEAYAWLGGMHYTAWVWRWNQDPHTLEQASALIQRAIALDDTLPMAYGMLGAVYASQQQYDQALAEGERAIALDPNDADCYAAQAEVLNFAGRSEEALRSVAQAMRLNPRYPDWYLVESGWAYLLLDRYAESIAALKQALARGPNVLPAYTMLADNYILQWAGQLSSDPQLLTQAYTTAQHAVTLNDAYAYAHSDLGVIYLYQEQYDLAIAEFERAVSLDATSGCAQMLLASALSRVGKIDEAVLMGEKGLRLETRSDRCAIAVAETYALAGRFEEARTILQRLLQRYPNFLPAHLTLATVYSELGREAEARAEAAQVLRINPKFSLEVHRQRMAIKDPAVLERYIAALRKAGLK